MQFWSYDHANSESQNWKFQGRNNKNFNFFATDDTQCLAEKLAVSLSRIRKAAVVFILDEL